MPPIDPRPWSVVMCSMRLAIIYAGQDAAKANAAFESSDYAVIATAGALGDAQTQAAITAGRMREIDRRKWGR